MATFSKTKRRLTAFLGLVVLCLGGYGLLQTPWATRSVEISCFDIKNDIADYIENMPDEFIPTGFSAPGALGVDCDDGVIRMRADIQGEVLGRSVTGTMYAIGAPRATNTNIISTAWEQITGAELQKRIVYDFYQFYIDADTFTIDGRPAISLVVAPGQEIVEDVAENTGIGRLTVGVLNALGRDTSDEVRDQWTEDRIYQFQQPLVNMFSNAVRGHINGRTLYEFDNAAERALFTFFKGFEIEDGNFALVFTIANWFLIGGIALIGAIYGFGWWVTTFILAARESGVVSEVIDDEMADKIGQAADLVKGASKL